MRLFGLMVALLGAVAVGAQVAPPARAMSSAEMDSFAAALSQSLASRCGVIRPANARERAAVLSAARGVSPVAALHAQGLTPQAVSWVQLQVPLNVQAVAAQFSALCTPGRWVLGSALDGATLGVALWSDQLLPWMSDVRRREAGVRAALDAINLERVRGGSCGAARMAPSSPLVADARLRQVSLDYLAAQLQRPTGHLGADGSTPATRAARAGLEGDVEEVLAYGLSDPLRVVQAWMASEAHCRVLRDPRLRRIGLDYQLGGVPGAVWGALLAP